MVVEGIAGWVHIDVSVLRVRKGYICATSWAAFFKTTMKKLSHLKQIKIKSKTGTRSRSSSAVNFASKYLLSSEIGGPGYSGVSAAKALVMCFIFMHLLTKNQLLKLQTRASVLYWVRARLFSSFQNSTLGASSFELLLCYELSRG